MSIKSANRNVKVRQSNSVNFLSLLALSAVLAVSSEAFASEKLADLLKTHTLIYERTKECDLAADGSDANCKDFNEADFIKSACEKCDISYTQIRLRLAADYVYEDEGRGKGLLFPVGKEEDISKNRLMRKFYPSFKVLPEKHGQFMTSANLIDNTLVLKSRNVEEMDFPKKQYSQPLDNAKIVNARFDTTTLTLTENECQLRITRHVEVRSYKYDGRMTDPSKRDFIWTGWCKLEPI